MCYPSGRRVCLWETSSFRSRNRLAMRRFFGSDTLPASIMDVTPLARVILSPTGIMPMTGSLVSRLKS